MTSQVSPRDVPETRVARYLAQWSLELYVPASAELSQSVDQAKASASQSLQLCGLDHFCTYAREGAAIPFSVPYVPASAELSQSVDQAKASEP